MPLVLLIGEVRVPYTLLERIGKRGGIEWKERGLQHKIDDQADHASLTPKRYRRKRETDRFSLTNRVLASGPPL